MKLIPVDAYLEHGVAALKFCDVQMTSEHAQSPFSVAANVAFVFVNSTMAMPVPFETQDFYGAK